MIKRLTNREIGMRLKSGRAARGFTLQQVAEMVGVDRSTIQRYETGGIVIVKLPVIESICQSLGLNPAWVLGESEEKYPPQKEPSYPEDVKKLADALTALPEEQRIQAVSSMQNILKMYSK